MTTQKIVISRTWRLPPIFRIMDWGTFWSQPLLKKARQMEYDKVTLEVRVSNTRAQKLYRDIGFVDNGLKKDYYYNDREDALNMILDITKIG